MKTPHIVIVGAGFAGIYTHQYLRRYFAGNSAEITIISRQNYFLFTPMLHEVATGSLAHHQVAESLREIIKKDETNLVVGEVEKIDLDIKKVYVAGKGIPYDYLVLATGAVTNFFGTPGAEENALVLKDLRDAIVLRNKFIDVFEKASLEEDVKVRRRLLSFAVVGGGATGVEIATEMADFFFGTFRRLYKGVIQKSDISLSLVTQSAELLTPMHKFLQEKALKVLKQKGIKVLLNAKVKEVRKDSIAIEGADDIYAENIVWAAGVKAQYPELAGNVIPDKSGRLPVKASLQLEGYENVFVLGDIALFLQDGKPLPMLAQVAADQAPIAAENIALLQKGKKLRSFYYSSRGELVSLGKYNAVARVFNINFYGFFAWFLWRTIYLFKFLSGSKRMKIAADWTVDLFYPRDITRA